MTSPLSLLGLIHTCVSLIPVVAGLYSFVRHQSIEPASRSGRIYLAGLMVSVLTAFGLSSTGGFNPGHAVGILALLAAFGSLLIRRLSILGRLRPYLATFGQSFSFFLLLVPGIAETLTRLPVAHPLAEGPQSALVRATLLAWFVIFIVGFALQAWAIRSGRTSAAR
ncbi:hypothetical protein [Comamonas testosteroni]|uniref:Membrane protein n=1 Tax=Comamonas testosteroni TaxID=285 RepID=A0A096FFQ3_COMTE|nr:hypothetical protein [Comamonas testosteroni]KGH28553.1 membrane protein [Comamonas testosteroni]